MRYVSTNGQTSAVSFDDAVRLGQAPDGGLFVPEAIPRIDVLGETKARHLAELAAEVLPPFVGGDVGMDFCADVFSFDIPIIDLGARSDRYEGIHVVELFHGPTGSFKDVGARFLAQWLSTGEREAHRERVVLVATSGDTGSAVAEAFAGQRDTSVVILYPFGGVSPYQRAQLTKPRDGVFPFAVRGSFDDCQRAVKEAFLDPSLSHCGLTSANSINVGRLLPQMLFYFWSAHRLACSTPLFVVPSGNLGNLCAGLIAGRSGMPGARFIGATNQNRFFVDFMTTESALPRPVLPSLSNAMDVAVPSNLARMMHLFGRRGLIDVLSTRSVDDAETRRMIGKIYRDTGYVTDPHTAVGLAALLGERRETERPALVMGTAHPAKYRELVGEVTGLQQVGDGEVHSEVAERVVAPGLDGLRRIILNIVEEKANESP